MANIGYRPEVDGLRAVSVIGVVLFHAGIGFSGGYVGVDVFFVISGFLISSIILRGLHKGSFSMLDFWVRRIRRILPAMSLTVGLTLIGGALILEPNALMELAESSVAQAVSASNFYFWITTDYFAESSEYSPLLHTWSLAVEEQFYIIFPFALVLIYRFAKGKMALILSLVALASLLLSIFVTETHRSFSFFLIPTRAWELLAGVLIAVFQYRVRFNRPMAEVTSAAGLIMIMVAMFYFDSRTVFPGASALLPICGAVAFILGSKDCPTLAGRLLSLRFFVFIGLISYSLYLWHWPLFSLAGHLLIEPGLALRLSLVAASVVLAYLSWKYVEVPMRKPTVFQTHVSAFTYAFVTVAVLLVASAALLKLDGLPHRVDPSMREVVEDISWNGSDYVSRNGVPSQIGVPADESGDSRPDFILWGDSHGMVLAQLFDDKAREHGLTGEAALNSGLVPIPELRLTRWSRSKTEALLASNRRTLAGIIERGIPNVILVGRWSIYCSGKSAVEIENGALLAETLVTDAEGAPSHPLTPQSATASVQRQLQSLLDQLEKAGTKVWLLEQVPESNVVNNARKFYQAHRFPRWNHLEPVTLDRASYELRQTNASRMFQELQGTHLTIVDTSEPFFDNESASFQVYSDRSLYRDDNHLTRYGVNEYLSGVVDRIMSEIGAAGDDGRVP